MPDDTVLKIAAAGLIHDIGKFADKTAMQIPQGFIDRHADIYQPFYHGRHTHAHAVYTAAFIETHADLLPRQFNMPGWGEGDALINLASGHHRPETPMQWIIAVADRVGSGWDRMSFDESYNSRLAWRDYKKTRLLPLFEAVSLDGAPKKKLEDFHYCLPLRFLSPESIFPGLREEVQPSEKEDAVREYKELFDRFVEGLGRLPHKEENIELWLDHFESLLMLSTSAIPSARAGDVLPDVSLYDHSKITAALAAALYLYHRDMDDFSIEAIRDYEVEKFLIVNGDFHGIQEFIFSGYGDTRRYRSKLLRGRSFAVSLFSELAADMLCMEIGLPASVLILNAAGRFTLIGPNTDEAARAVENIEARVNDWLVRFFHGESSMGLSFVSASAADFVLGNFPGLWDRINDSMETKKAARLDLERHGGAIQEYLDRFDNRLSRPLCPLCGKRPSSNAVEGSYFIQDVESACTICRDHIYLGTNLVKKGRLAVSIPERKRMEGEEGLLENIFDIYQVKFLEGQSDRLPQGEKLRRYWDISRKPNEIASSHGSVRFLAGYVPIYTEEDFRDDRFLAGEKSDSTKMDMLDQMVAGDPKTLNHISMMALHPKPEVGGFQGTDALGVLKADVDQLGLIMACGLEEGMLTLSRMAAMSRQLHQFFSLFVPWLLAEEYRNVYTVFAGGDDLFLIGPWSVMKDLSLSVHKWFKKFVCQNESLDLSAGISIHKPHTPLDRLAASAEEALARSKTERRRTTVFSETVTWDELSDLCGIQDKLSDWLEKGLIRNTMMYRLNTLIAMAALEKRILSEDAIPLDEMASAKWRALLSYSAGRNVAPNLKGPERDEKVKEIVADLAVWLAEHEGKLRIPLWHILYNRR